MPASNYTTEAGSVVLALSASYLETLSVGGHELTAVFSDGVGTASFEVKAATSETEQAATASEASPKPAVPVSGTTASAGALPKTTDALPVAFLGAMAFMSALVLAAS